MPDPRTHPADLAREVREHGHRQRRLDPARELPAALATLLGPELPGARCAGRAPLHDLDVQGERPGDRDARHARALQVCETCPVLDACRAAVSDLHHVVGVWGGVVHEPSAERARLLAANRRRRAGAA